MRTYTAERVVLGSRGLVIRASTSVVISLPAVLPSEFGEGSWLSFLQAT